MKRLALAFVNPMSECFSGSKLFEKIVRLLFTYTMIALASTCLIILFPILHTNVSTYFKGVPPLMVIGRFDNYAKKSPKWENRVR